MTMPAATQPGLTVTIEPLTVSTFEPFGDVIAHAGGERRRFFPQVHDHVAEARQASFWVSRVDEVATLPLTVTQLERHPFSAQTFLPLTGARYLVIVAGSDSSGGPAPETLRAFLAGPGQGVTYRRDVWHHGMTILDGPAQFAVLMHKTGRDDDDVFLDLARPVVVSPVLALAGDTDR
ncbi:ureidoglycolate lyase [Methylobacterium indicum]|uniref:ureidoglycolate lyase n=2 Tax=Methylobacterium indicum TaxID=1775910 RepID=UPI000A899FF1|nr:ureidoglycolate lyase [Methylobacterium indicum]